MSLELSVTPDLDSPEVCAFLGSQQRFYLSPIDTTHLESEGFKTTLQYKESPQKEKIQLVSGRILKYQAVYGSAVIGEPEVSVPVTHILLLGVRGELLVRENLSPEALQAISDAFNDFDFSVDLEQFVTEQQVLLGVTPSDFYLALTFTLEKVGEDSDLRGISHEAELNWLLSFNSGETEVTWGIPKPDMQLYRYTLISERLICPYEPMPTPDGVVEVNVITDEQLNEQSVKQHVLGHGQVSGCEIDDIANKRIATIYQWPEFRVIWVNRVIKIGCTRVILKLPKLEMRTVKKAAYGASAYESRFRDQVLDIIEDCLENSVVSSVVVGLLTWNLASAVAAFTGIFVRCIQLKSVEAIPCLIPEIVILTEDGDWVAAL